MLLAIDAGNTETVVGLYEAGATGSTDDSPAARGGLAFHWRLSTTPIRTPDEHAVILTQLLDLEGLDVTEVVTGIAICSSVPEATAQLRKMAARWFEGVDCVVLGPGTRTGMPIRYANPKEVGADRIANAVGAFEQFGGPCVVVDLGTATTFDAISADGEYLGGAIAPGVAISLDALYAHAAALRAVELVEPRAVIGQSTEEAIQSGVLYGFAAQLDGMCARIAGMLGPSTVVATGGLSSLIVPYATCVDHLEPWLTLHGLRTIYERNGGVA
jgi:type III pantothenate kinase